MVRAAVLPQRFPRSHHGAPGFSIPFILSAGYLIVDLPVWVSWLRCARTPSQLCVECDTDSSRRWISPYFCKTLASVSPIQLTDSYDRWLPMDREDCESPCRSSKHLS